MNRIDPLIFITSNWCKQVLLNDQPAGQSFYIEHCLYIALFLIAKLIQAAFSVIFGTSTHPIKVFETLRHGLEVN